MLDLLNHYIFGNPDFGHSDIWHLSLPLRSFFADALHRGMIPFWSKDIGTGYPVFAEGEVGMLHPVNLVLYRFLPTIMAFNVSYIISYLTLFLGCFFYARAIKLSRLVAIFFAFIFVSSGIAVTQVRAPQFIQALSYTPWLFFSVELFITSAQKRWLLLFTATIALQLLTGYPQIFVICALGVGIYTAFRLWPIKNKRATASTLLYLSLGCVLALLIASPQLFATWQLIGLSHKASGLDVSILAQFPYHPKNLLSFINPYFWGDPRIGTYPRFDSNWGVFWESTGYFGLLPFLLSLGSFFWLKKNPFRKTYVIIALIALILLLGKFTLFFFVFQIPPLSFFRVPARFLILFVWSLAILASLILQTVRDKYPKLAIIIFLVTIVDLGNFALGYNPIIDTKKWLAEPETVKILKNDRSWYRTYSIIPGEEWNSILLTSGWKDIERYTDFRNAIDPNQNLYWGIPSVDAYNGIYPRRLDIYSGLIRGGIVSSDTSLTISTPSAKLLSLAGAKYVISARKVANDNWPLVASTSGQPTFYIYQNPSVFPHAYLTDNYQVATSLSDLIDKTISTNSATVLETKIDLQPKTISTDQIIPVEVVVDSDNEVVIQIPDLKDSSLLILSDSYYPTWEAYLDGKEIKIHPANINQRAIIIPSGAHNIRFIYRQPLYKTNILYNKKQ